ncbi:MAG: hypothetical protein PHF56_12985 [Desulfuromonadaceae bacterium]|nr:hypothetical protein [Desulfuromonadaceae bacterium]
MPWYTNPAITRKVLHRIANRYARASLQELNSTLDKATQMLWNKQHQYVSYNQTGAHN